MACSSLSIPLPRHLPWPVGSEQPLSSQKSSFGKETGELVQGLGCLQGPGKRPVSPKGMDIFPAGEALAAPCPAAGGVFPERGGCCPGTVGAQALVAAELPSFGLRLQLQPERRAPPAAQLARQGHPGSRSRAHSAASSCPGEGWQEETGGTEPAEAQHVPP